MTVTVKDVDKKIIVLLNTKNVTENRNGRRNRQTKNV